MKGLINKILTPILVAGALSFSGIKCGTATYYYDNFQNPELFYENEQIKKESHSELIATLGSAMSVLADNEKESALGAALTTYGL